MAALKTLSNDDLIAQKVKEFCAKHPNVALSRILMACEYLFNKHRLDVVYSEYRKFLAKNGMISDEYTNRQKREREWLEADINDLKEILKDSQREEMLANAIMGMPYTPPKPQYDQMLEAFA